MRLTLPSGPRDDFYALRREHQAHAALADIIEAATGITVERPDPPERPQPGVQMKRAAVVDVLDPVAVACKQMFDDNAGRRVTITLDGPDADKVAEHLGEYARWVDVEIADAETRKEGGADVATAPQ